MPSIDVPFNQQTCKRAPHASKHTSEVSPSQLDLQRWAAMAVVSSFPACSPLPTLSLHPSRSKVALFTCPLREKLNLFCSNSLILFVLLVGLVAYLTCLVEDFEISHQVFVVAEARFGEQNVGSERHFGIHLECRAWGAGVGGDWLLDLP